MTGKCPQNISYQESDQTPVRGTDSVDLSMYLRSGETGSNKTICCGDYEKFLWNLHDLSDDEVKVLLSGSGVNVMLLESKLTQRK